MVTFISRSSKETRALGEAWGRTAAAGLVIGLTGDLGAGKTEFVRGLACGLGIEAQVQSPTFALVHEYSGGRLPLFHLDLYRLESPVEVTRAGLEEYLDQTSGVTVIEWVERWTVAWPVVGPRDSSNPATSFRQVTIETIDQNERRITQS